MIFKQILKIFLILIIYGQVNLIFAQDSSFEQLTKLLNDLTSMHAHFTQTVTNKSGINLQEQTGIMQLKKPNLLRWQTLTPDQTLLVVDGNKIWNYDEDLRQVIVKNFSSEINDAKIAGLLLGDLQKMLDNFEISKLENFDNKNIIIGFVLKAKDFQKDDIFVKAELGFNNKNQLVMLKLYDQLEQETEFLFSKIKNIVDIKEFKFVVPEGVDIIED